MQAFSVNILVPCFKEEGRDMKNQEEYVDFPLPTLECSKLPLKLQIISFEVSIARCVF